MTHPLGDVTLVLLPDRLVVVPSGDVNPNCCCLGDVRCPNHADSGERQGGGEAA